MTMIPGFDVAAKEASKIAAKEGSKAAGKATLAAVVEALGVVMQGANVGVQSVNADNQRISVRTDERRERRQAQLDSAGKFADNNSSAV